VPKTSQLLKKYVLSRGESFKHTACTPALTVRPEQKLTHLRGGDHTEKKRYEIEFKTTRANIIEQICLEIRWEIASAPHF
jgi:hypothetical protein